MHTCIAVVFEPDKARIPGGILGSYLGSYFGMSFSRDTCYICLYDWRFMKAIDWKPLWRSCSEWQGIRSRV